MNYNDFDKTKAFKLLQSLAASGSDFSVKKLLTADRVKNYNAPIVKDLFYNWAAKSVDEKILDALQDLSNEQELIPKYKSILEGFAANTGEGRMVLHHLLRSAGGKSALKKPSGQGQRKS